MVQEIWCGGSLDASAQVGVRVSSISSLFQLHGDHLVIWSVCKEDLTHGNTKDSETRELIFRVM